MRLHFCESAFEIKANLKSGPRRAIMVAGRVSVAVLVAVSRYAAASLYCRSPIVHSHTQDHLRWELVFDTAFLTAVPTTAEIGNIVGFVAVENLLVTAGMTIEGPHKYACCCWYRRLWYCSRC